MYNNFLKGCILIFIVALQGCGMTVRTYVEKKARVDQSLEGNRGYLLGMPQDASNSNVKSTRNIYVLEIATPPVNYPIPRHFHKSDVKGTSEEIPSGKVSGGEDFGESLETEFSSPRGLPLPSLGDEGLQGEKEEPAAPDFVEYKVEKDDTLQKISKRFYGSYSKWPRIYEANRDKISNPDQIQPGITIKVPLQ